MYNKNFSKLPTEKQIIGEIGESYACDHLSGVGYRVIERNYLRKWGEIDIVAKIGAIIHFIEVKTVTRDRNCVAHETGDYRAEENVHPWKLARLSRAIQSYLLERDVSDETEWQLDIAIVYVDKDKKPYNVFLLEDITI